MNGKYVNLDAMSIWVCDACLEGTHLSYGTDHRTGEVDRRDCKNVSDDNRRQCGCNPDWPELMEVITREQGTEN